MKLMSEVIGIPQCNPLANYLSHKNEIDTAVHNVINSGRYVLSEEVSKFEEEFADFMGAKYCIATANGTEALTISLQVCGIGPGDAVITPSHTAVATAAAIQQVGATPLFADICSTSFTINPDYVESIIQREKYKVKAIIPVHIYGYPCNMDAFMSISKRYGLYLIEDCAQAHGAKYDSKSLGAIGHLGAFSFYPTKNLSALGDGGAIITNNTQFAEQAKLIRQYGWKERYISIVSGQNSRLDELQAAILRVKLKFLNEDNKKRNQIAHYYDQKLSGISEDLILPLIDSKIQQVFHQYVVKTSRRDELRKYLLAKDIDTGIHYPLPVHLQPAYIKMSKMQSPSLPNTESIVDKILSLPMYPEMTLQQQKQVVESIVGFFNMKK